MDVGLGIFGRLRSAGVPEGALHGLERGGGEHGRGQNQQGEGGDRAPRGGGGGAGGRQAGQQGGRQEEQLEDCRERIHSGMYR